MPKLIAHTIPSEVRTPSVPLARLFRHCLATPEVQPCSLDDVFDVLETLTNAQVADITGVNDGCIKEGMYDELSEMYILLPGNHLGWAVEILGEGTVNEEGQTKWEKAKAAA